MATVLCIHRLFEAVFTRFVAGRGFLSFGCSGITSKTDNKALFSMMIVLLHLLTIGFLSTASFVFAWETDQRCLDLYRDLRKGAPENATSLALVEDQAKPPKLRRRQLQTNFIFQIKMHWEVGYCVSASWTMVLLPHFCCNE